MGPVSFFFTFLLVSAISWILITFAAQLLAQILSRVMGASVHFRVGGLKSLKDINVQFKKGAIESVSVGEIKLSFRQSLIKLEPKVRLLIRNLEVVMRPPTKSSPKTRSGRSRSSGSGKLMGAANAARFLSVCITELVVKTPKAIVEVKELGVNISKEEGSLDLLVKLHLLLISFHLVDSQTSSDRSSNFNHDGYISSRKAPLVVTEKTTPLHCEEFSLSCEFGPNREDGISVRNVDISTGEIALNLNEEIFVKKKTSTQVLASNTEILESNSDSTAMKKPSKFSALNKHASLIPEKFTFSLPTFNVKCVHRGHNLVIDNNIMGMQLKSVKSKSVQDGGESTHFDIQLDFSEIHFFREDGISIVEILKLDVLCSTHIPLEPTLPIRSDIDIKLGDSRFNLVLSRLKLLMHLQSSKTKKMVLQEGTPNPKRQPSTESTAIIWTCSVAAPEMAIMLYDLSGSPLYHGCMKSFRILANNTSNTSISAHMALGELNLLMADEYQEFIKEGLFGVVTNTAALFHISKVSLDWGRKDIESSEDGSKSKLVLSIDVCGIGLHFTFKRVESLVTFGLSLKSLLKSRSSSNKKSSQNQGKPATSSGKGAQLINFNLEGCSVSYNGDFGLDNVVVPDPKRVNYGSQGGRVIISTSADGTPRSANVMSTVSEECKMLKYMASIDIFHFSLTVNKEKQSMQTEVENAKSIYQEYLEDNEPGTKVSLLDLQNLKFVRRSGGLKDAANCSLLSAAEISVRWEPDIHIAFFELMLRMKLLVHNIKAREAENNCMETTTIVGQGQEEPAIEPALYEKQQKKKDSLFAVDVELLNISADAGDGVEVTVQVQSIFSENASIGVLLEGLILTFNEARVFKSSRMQISRIPNVSRASSEGKSDGVTTWDWVIQGLDVHVSMPYRLQLRAIDDSVEDMLRALKLITAAKTMLIFPWKKESTNPKKPSSSKFGCVRFCIRKLTVDIEEEPLQGWLDEHYHLRKNEAWELAVRMKYLDELASRAMESPETADINDPSHEGKILYKGEEVDIQDASVLQSMREDIYKESFKSYYQACNNIVPSEGSGAYKIGFQSGFKLSKIRSSLISIVATELDVSLTKIGGGDSGMIEVIQKLDPISKEENIPFSRLYGSNILLRAGSLVVQIRNYTYPIFAGTSGRCEGRIVLAQQATSFQPQMQQNVFVGRWRKVCMLRSVSGTTPPMKTYFDFPLHFQKAEAAFGVGFEPSFTDISYAFTVALRRANLSVRNPNFVDIQPPKKEKNLPWWDDMRNYIHGNISLFISETNLNILATPDPYEKSDTLQILTGHLEIHQSDGRIYFNSLDFKVFANSLDILLKDSNLNLPKRSVGPILEVPDISVEVINEWGCDSGNPMNHYLFALPIEGVARDIVFDPFRSTSWSLRWDISLRSSSSGTQSQAPPIGEEAAMATVSDNCKMNSPTVSVGTYDLPWLVKFITVMYLPPYKLRTFSRWPRYGVPRIVRSGNLPMDKVMTEFMLRMDITPTCIKHVPLDDEDPAKGLTFEMEKLKYEMYFGRGKQIFTFDCKRDTLDLVYQGVDFHMPKAYLDKEACVSVAKLIQMAKRKISKSPSMEKDGIDKNISTNASNEKHRDDGFLFHSDYFIIRKHSPKADPARLVAWQEAGRKNKEVTHVKSEFENRSDGGEHTQSDPSDDEDYNVVVADSCQRVFVYGLKLLWTIENRDAVFSWVRGLGKALQAKPSPSRQYAQRKLLEYNLAHKPERPQDETSESPTTDEVQPSDSEAPPIIVETAEAENVLPAAVARTGNNDDIEEEGTRHFMVNIIEPQFNLHSEDANGRFLLAAASGRVLARSFHAVVQVGAEMLEQALGTGGSMQIPESQPEMTWNRMEFSVMLEHVQAHVAPTDVDPGAGLQWLPKIRKSSPKVKRTGALLENVFTPCDMFLRFTRHNGGTTDMKIKPLKELSFNCQNITATMTSRQFQVMLDVLTNLLFARVPKPRKSSLLAEDGEDVEEEADEVVPEGVEEVELARINLEQKEREQNMILFDIRMLSSSDDFSTQMNLEKEGNLWMIEGRKPTMVQKLKNELGNAKKLRKASSASLREALQKAAQQRLVEKEKNRTPSCAMRISVQINKVVWTLLADGKTFAEAEISDMIYDFDRDYKDFGVAKFTTKYFVARNCLPNAKFDMVLSPWNPPAEWGKKVMLRVDVKQGAPKDGGNCPIENFQVEIYPLKIHLTEHLYHVVWGYLFPEEEQDSQRRQEVWKVSTTAGTKRGKKGSSVSDVASMGNLSKDIEVSSKNNPSSGSNKADSSQATKNKANVTRGSELRRTSSFDRWEENVAESVADELVMQAQSSKMGSIGIEMQDEPGKNKQKDNKTSKTGKAASQEEKKAVKQQDDKRSRPQRLREFRNVKISQVELLVTYEGPPLSFTELRLLMDTFQRVDFTGTWSRLFSRVKKHVIWGVLKSVTGMQGKKFKAVSKETPSTTVPDTENALGMGDGSSADKSGQNLLALAAQRSTDGAGDGFVTSVKGLFSNQRKKAKKFVLRTMRGENENEFSGDWSDGDAEFSPFARQLTISKAKKLIRRHTKKFEAKGQKDSSEQSSPTGEIISFEMSSSDESSADENESRD